mmetsp:Transcript_56179/g.111540  ORF Transcript_56179/g.111540 Transcript_56179/m.111540 type:complete len:541 (-) Transcript_56179:285-1907(-)|eukprot:CAMPEP_0174731546 /NCGR_PEP_ID=MMETSP1094-20130205/57741_1 /TAXON_ID=156173 /ORGANISM="Chrysochromulina brevifilum, Strain UTEX LB 985" /LENGTH=540 /DNA_ID=CAMNT_0015933937 /DNA_START=38 /DNA_END=1660 /DNA_ORIENTATION=+
MAAFLGRTMILLSAARHARASTSIFTAASPSLLGSHAAGCRRASRLLCTVAVEAPATATAAGLKRRKVAALVAQGEGAIGSTVILKGWVRTVRSQKTFSFVEVNDGSSLAGLQVVAPNAIASYSVVEELTTGAAVSIIGEVVASKGKGQSIELRAESVELVGDCPSETYPLQKKRHSLEFMRSIAHLRPRSNLFGAVSRVRSALAQATHAFFAAEGFKYVQTPIVTASDCEGAGEMFRVTTLDPTAAPSPPPSKPPAPDAPPADPFAEDFFGKAAYLTVSGQLSAETYACALGDVYTFGPTFRAEDSNTARHLAEFWMIEPEMAFADLNDDMDNAEAYVKHVVRHVMETCPDDLKFFGSFVDKELLGRLELLVNEDFARVSYGEAVEMLQAEISKDPSKWEYPEVVFGTDLATEHERWLSEVAFGRATFVYNYPKEIKSFYMRDNDDGKTVAAMDLLVPGIGELIGGSQREERMDVLCAKMADAGLREEDYSWYLDLRRYGSVPHAGYGLGFERLVCYVTGVANIRDAIAFPRYPGSCEF